MIERARLVRPILLAAHLTAQVFFLYMFFSAGRIDKLAAEGAISADAGSCSDESAARYAAAWRHGMTGGWWLYMPGFFATAVSAWFWSQSKTRGRLAIEGSGAMVCSVMVGLALAESGGETAVSDFVRDTGCRVLTAPPGLSTIAVAQGVYTLIAWTSFAVCGRLCLERRSLRPLLLPAILGCILIFVRPFTLDDAGDVWARRALSGDPTAAASLALVPVSAWGLVRAELFRLRRRRSHELGMACAARRV